MARLPQFLKEYFRDVAFDEIDMNEHRIFILKRIMEFGNDKAAAWMLKNFSTADMKKALCKYRRFTGHCCNET